jgi:protein-disulfide isomerase
MGPVISWRLLFTGLLVASLVPRGIAQSSNENGALPEHPENVFLSLDGAPAMGDEKARIAIVEFSDYQCPFCVMHANQALPPIVTDYVKTGKVRYFFKDFPIDAVHPQAFKGAEAARCAGEQGKYWEMHDRLLRNQQPQVVNELAAYALALGLDVPKFQQCLDNGTYAAQVRKDIQEGTKYRVQGTPTFFVGILDGQGSRMKAVTMLYGAQPYPAFQKALDQILTTIEEEKASTNGANAMPLRSPR